MRIASSAARRIQLPARARSPATAATAQCRARSDRCGSIRPAWHVSTASAAARCNRTRSGVASPASTASRTRSWTNRCSPGVEDDSTSPATAASSRAARHSSTGTSTMDATVATGNSRPRIAAARSRPRTVAESRSNRAPMASRTLTVTDDANDPVRRRGERGRPRRRRTGCRRSGRAPARPRSPRAPVRPAIADGRQQRGRADHGRSSCHVAGSRGRSASRTAGTGPVSRWFTRTISRSPSIDCATCLSNSNDPASAHWESSSTISSGRSRVNRRSSRVTASNSRNRSSADPAPSGPSVGAVNRSGASRARSAVTPSSVAAAGEVDGAPQCAQGLPPWPVRRGSRRLGRRTPRHRDAVRARRELLGQSGLADPGLAPAEDDSRATGAHGGECLRECGKLPIAADELRPHTPRPPDRPDRDPP